MMEVISFFVVDENNVVIQVGASQARHLKDNALPGTLHIGNAPQGAYKYIDNNFIPYEEVRSYDMVRAAAYPSPAEQLDMLWHAMDTYAMPRSEPFYTSLSAIKSAYPKPDEGT